MDKPPSSFEQNMLFDPNELVFDDFLQMSEPLISVERALHSIVFTDANKVNVDGLTEGALSVYLVLVFVFELENGGMKQFFYNSSGNYARETVKALREIGAINAVNCLQSALLKFGDYYSSDISVRRKNLISHADGLQEVFLATSREYYANVCFDTKKRGENENVADLLTKYMHEHRSVHLIIKASQNGSFETK